MPLILERKEPLKMRQSISSAIPRPVKQLVLKGVCHASKPTTDSRLQSNIQQRTPLNQLQQTPVDPTIPVLELVPFGRQPSVDFGRVPLKETRVKYVSIRNTTDYVQQLFIKTFPKDDKGFNVDATEFLLGSKTEIFVAIGWTPQMLGSIRESITLQDINKMAKRIILYGTAESPRNFTNTQASARMAVVRPTMRQNNQPKINTRLSSLPPRSNKMIKPLTRLKLESKSRRQSGQVLTKLLAKNDNIMAVKIQSYWRMILATRELKKLKEQAAASKIQSCWRIVLARREANRLRAQAKVIKLQSYFRMFLAQLEFQRLKEQAAATKIQAYWRMVLAQRVAKQRLAIVTIQKYWRMCQERSHYRKIRLSTIIIQSHARGLICRRRLKAQSKAALIVQKHWRMSRERSRFKKLKSATITIQSYTRGLILRRHLKAQFDSAVIIQKYWRMWREKLRLEKLKLGAVIVQCRVRGIIYRRHLRRSIDALIKIQQGAHVQEVTQ